MPASAHLASLLSTAGSPVMEGGEAHLHPNSCNCSCWETQPGFSQHCTAPPFYMCPASPVGLLAAADYHGCPDLPNFFLEHWDSIPAGVRAANKEHVHLARFRKRLGCCFCAESHLQLFLNTDNGSSALLLHSVLLLHLGTGWAKQ